MLTNLYGAAILYKKVMPIMLNQKFGRVLSLGSKLAENPKALTSAYSASKAGLTALTFSVVQELYQKTESYPNIYFDILYPGPTATNLLNPKGGESEIRKQLANGGQAPSVVYKYVKLLLRSKFRLTGNIYLKNKVIKRVDIKCQIKQLISYFKRK
jgi:short-subunit dehydrogenase